MLKKSQVGMFKTQNGEMDFLNRKSNWLLLSCWCPVITLFAFFEPAKLCSAYKKPDKFAYCCAITVNCHFLFMTSCSHIIFLVPVVSSSGASRFSKWCQLLPLRGYSTNILNPKIIPHIWQCPQFILLPCLGQKTRCHAFF